jgi:hypothetical protein
MVDRYELKLNVLDKFWFTPTLESEFNTNLFTSSGYQIADVQTQCFCHYGFILYIVYKNCN